MSHDNLRVGMPGGWSITGRRATGGDVPVMLVHGFPCTSLLWTHTLPRLAAAGCDVVAVDLRGFGDSDPAPDGCYDLASFGADLTRVADSLGWGPFVLAAHDLGASVCLELAIRQPDRVEGLLLMNHVVPEVPDGPAVGSWSDQEAAEIFDYAVEQGHRADALMARLDTGARRRAYVTSFYRDRGWCPPGAFDPASLALLSAPFSSAERLRIAFHDYEIAAGTRAACEPERLGEPVPCPVSVLLGTHDVTLAPDISARCAAAYGQLVAYAEVPDAGHFLPWERPRLVADAILALATRDEA